jgi:hypothetical protein
MFEKPQGAGVVIRDGTYEAVYKECKERPRQYRDDPPVPGVEFTFLVMLPSGNPVELNRHITLSTGPKSNLFKDLVAVLGKERWEVGLKTQEAFDAMIRGMIGKSALVTTVAKLSKNGNEYSNITNVMALPNGYVTKLEKPAAEPAVSGQGVLDDMGKGKQYYYDLGNLPADKMEKAQKLIKSAGGGFDTELNSWVTPNEVKALVKFMVDEPPPF